MRGRPRILTSRARHRSKGQRHWGNNKVRRGFPQARAGQVVGLLGGSFDPAHAGHAHLSREALKRFALDQLWWLVSPGNPLKQAGPAPLDQRMARARQVMQHPRVRITDLETHLGTRHTAKTLARLQALYPGVRFVWLMGADNLADLHRWQDWKSITRRVPLGVLARPSSQMQALFGSAARSLRAARIAGPASRSLGRQRAPAWCFARMPLRAHSSSAIRHAGGWHDGRG